MPLFVDGEDIDNQFPTSLGPVGVMASVHVFGSTLELRDVIVYAGDGSYLPVGTRRMLEIARIVEQLAKMEGFTRVRTIGKRLSGAKPGRSVFLDRRIR